VIKVLSYQNEGVGEVEILKYLSSEPVKSEIDNPIVPVLEFLNYNGWIFAVQPRWGDCMEPEIESVDHGLEFCVQVTKVRASFKCILCSLTLTPSKGVAFLHRHLVAHLVCVEGSYQITPSIACSHN
jgi:hypothetical protein